VKKEIRRIIQDKTQFTCDICGKRVRNAGRYEYRPAQFTADYVPRHLTKVCRNCIYKESFGSKGMNLRKKQNQIEEESHLYAEIK
tara:strand:- start:304 stop:558 length:255 start_codon:yes stop_codon:yes gene_type:complete